MIKRRKKSSEEIAKNKKDSEKMKDFFLEIWNERPHYSEISGKWLGKEPLTIFFHHILKSRKYPEAKYDKENIILLTFEEHQSAEHYEHKFPKIQFKKQDLLTKYNYI